MYPLNQITGFTSQEEVVSDLWNHGSFPIEGDQVCHVTLRDRFARGLNTSTTHYVGVESPTRNAVGQYPGSSVPFFATPPQGHYDVKAYYGSPSFRHQQMAMLQQQVVHQPIQETRVESLLEKVTDKLTSLALQNEHLHQKFQILEARQLQTAPNTQQSQAIVPSPPSLVVHTDLAGLSSLPVQTVLSPAMSYHSALEDTAADGQNSKRRKGAATRSNRL